MFNRFQKHLDLIIYQIYPRSFYDTNGDGIGDLKGVMQKLDYLCDLGVNAIWLCPCYKSPLEDNGYDVSDYRDILDDFGTLDDAKQLIAEMHKRGMKLIMDLVPNHTSSEHPWFRESRKSRDNPYSDYYCWYDEPQNDWKASFGGDAWQYDEARQQYYLHSFAVGQPDLNWDNPKVVKEMQDIVDFWVDLGVDGFRIDVIDNISKDLKSPRKCLGPHIHEYIHALFGRPSCAHLFTVGECACDDIDEVVKHCGEDRHELVTLFQFEHNEVGRNGKWFPSKDEEKLKKLRGILNKWQMLTAENDIIYSLFTDNHDQNFFLSRAADDKELRYESATALATIFYLLKGVPFIFQGQEFGSVGSEFDSLSDFRDIETYNYYHMNLGKNGQTHESLMEQINFGSRDNTRRPVAWSGDAFSGFSTSEPWITLPSRSKEIHLEKDLSSEKSIFRFYQQLLALRNTSEAIRYGSYRMLNREEDNFFIYERALGDESYVVVCNFEKEASIALPNGKLVLTNYARTDGDAKPFRPYEVAVYRV